MVLPSACVGKISAVAGGVVMTILMTLASLNSDAYGICQRVDPFDGVTMLNDTDCDGLPDSWEGPGGFNYDHVGGPEIILTDSLPDHKDIFLEIDYAGSYHNPLSLAKDDVSAAFNAAPVWNPPTSPLPGVKLHFLPGEDVQSLLGAESCGDWATFNNIKSQRLGTATERADPNHANIWQARNQATHYVLSIDTQCSDPASSGTAEIFGNDMIISLGGSGWGSDGMGHNVGSRAEQAGTIMHELGHNLNLRHGGNIDTNCKPNYISAMSYTFEFPTFVSDRILDFSRSTLNSLNENAGLNELTGIIKANPTTAKTAYGPPTVQVTQPLSLPNNAINWNRIGGSSDTGVTANINNLGITDCNFSTLSTLYGYTDWLGLIFWGSGGNFANMTLPGGGSNASLSNNTSGIPSTNSINLSSIPNNTMANITTNFSSISKSTDQLASPAVNLTSVQNNTVSNLTSNLTNIHTNLSSTRDLPPCDLQDPSCTLIPCDPRSLTCALTLCDPEDRNCTPRPSGNPSSTGPEFTVRELHDSRVRALETIDEKIESLPNSKFTNPDPSNVATQKASFHSKILTDLDSVKSFSIQDNKENDAKGKMNMIRGLAIAAMNSSTERAEILSLVDNFINALDLQK